MAEAEPVKINSFCMELRKATRSVHKISDALVNAKLAFALSDDSVWVDGMLVFYEIFIYLEKNVPPNILPPMFHRQEAFEDDLLYYLGDNWKNSYVARPEVLNYLQHLQNINKNDPILLMAYVYHLYMGLLSGGQILQKKRSIARRIYPISNIDSICPGEKLTNFNDYSISQLKKLMRDNIDHIANDLDDKQKYALLEESRKVFELNNQIIRTVKSVNKAGIKKILIFIIMMLLIWCVYRYIFW